MRRTRTLCGLCALVSAACSAPSGDRTIAPESDSDEPGGESSAHFTQRPHDMQNLTIPRSARPSQDTCATRSRSFHRSVEFDHGSSELNEESQTSLAELANRMDSMRFHTLMVEGHARPAEDHPLSLARDRALVVRAALISHGLSARRLQATSFLLEESTTTFSIGCTYPAAECSECAPSAGPPDCTEYDTRLAHWAGDRLITEAIRFQRDSHVIETNSLPVVDAVAHALCERPGERFEIRAHGLRSPELREHYQTRSPRRAAALRQALIERGFAAARLSALEMEDQCHREPADGDGDQESGVLPIEIWIASVAHPEMCRLGQE